MAIEYSRRRASALMVGAVLVPGCMDSPQPPAARRTGPKEVDPRSGIASVLSRIVAEPAIDGAGARVGRIFPSSRLRNLDPFVLLDDFDVGAPAGFPTHPHRGFEAFTYMVEGAFEHKDSMGNESLVTAGGIQRFNSGRGAYHSEMPGTPGRNRGLQLWVNLPRRLKGMAPEYEGLQGEAMPAQKTATSSVRKVAGHGAPASLHTAVDYRDVLLLADAEFRTDVEEGWNTLVYVLDGGIRIGGERLQRGQGVLVGPGALSIAGEGRFVYLSGRPHGEPIRHRGPFVD